MDQALLSLMEAAETGQQVPRLYIWTGGLVVTGRLISADQCRQYFTDSILSFKPEERDDLWSGTIKKVPPEVEEEFEQKIGSLGTPAPDPEVLNLGEANLSSASGETVSIPAVRISVPLINAWFTGKYTSKAKGGSFFVGGILPLDF